MPMMYAQCARPHADVRPVCTPPRRWTPPSARPHAMDARCARPPRGRAWAYLGVHGRAPHTVQQNVGLVQQRSFTDAEK